MVAPGAYATAYPLALAFASHHLAIAWPSVCMDDRRDGEPYPVRRFTTNLVKERADVSRKL